ncbi:helix-turn-helix transcriptional regulator [Vibrio sp. IRLE0018]|uniref:helix-turn-helix transcriptional regulator n=1 Tax=Vibrio TaxID=662 RepID=UPI001593EE9A|nr:MULTISPECIES: helix-turn-helix transcriptional regulator [Vibrio]MCF8777767.1 helix-turn-helix transcriptional regulator [Vibrio floridensis]NVC61762.1 helix-turn-helix transcriptional regulator [Vibrio sp. 05-20-BW147]
MEKDIHSSISRFSQLIDSLYQAPVHPRGFEPFLEQMVDEFRLADAVFYIQSSYRGELVSGWMAGPQIDAVLEYIELDLAEGNLVNDFVAAQPIGRFYSLDKHIGKQAHLTSKEQKVEAWFDRHGFCDVAAALVGHADGNIAFLSVHRNEREKPLSETDLYLMEILVPHIQRAFTLYQQFKASQKYTVNLTQIISQLPHAALLYDSKGAFVAANYRAKDLISLQENLTLLPSELKFRDTERKKEFMLNIQETLHHRSAKNDDACKVMHFMSPRGGLTLLFVAIGLEAQTIPKGYPIALEEKQLLDEGIGCIVYLYDREKSATLNPTLLKPIFNFTDAETEVCQLLALGYSRDEIAQLSHRSPHTIKDHIKSIYSKTGTGKQSDLIATILTSPAHTP